MTSGSAPAAARRAGRSLRVTSHAEGTATSTDATTTPAREQHGVRTRRHVVGSRRMSSAGPLPATRITRYPSGSSSSATTTPPASTSGRGASSRSPSRSIGHVGSRSRAAARRWPRAPRRSSKGRRRAPRDRRAQEGPPLLRSRQRADTRLPLPLIHVEALEVLGEQELDESIGVVALVGACEHGCARDADERAQVARCEEVVRDRRVRLLLLHEIEVVVVHEVGVDLASGHRLDDRRVVSYSFGCCASGR